MRIFNGGTKLWNFKLLNLQQGNVSHQTKLFSQPGDIRDPGLKSRPHHFPKIL